MTGLIPVSQFFRFFSFSSLYDRFVFICSTKSLQCTVKNRTKKSIAIFDVPKTGNFSSGGVQNHETKNRRVGMIVMSFQDFKLCRKLMSQLFSYCELINSPRNGTKKRCL